MSDRFTEPSFFSGNRPSAPRIDRHNSGTSSIRLEDSSDYVGGGVAGFGGSATSKFTGAAVSVLTRIQDRLPERLQPYFWLGLWFSFVGLIIGLFAGFHSQIFQFLESLATYLKELGPLGPPVLMACLFATSFPPLIGYSSIVTMAGYVYGFVFGFAIAFSGALAGSIVCFYFCRRWFKPQVRTLMSRNKSLKSVVRTVEKRGFRLLVLIRLAPYPFNVMNALLSATHIPLPTFTLATALSLFKLTLHVYIGSTLSTLTGSDPEDEDPTNPNKKGHGKALKIVVMVMSILLGIGVGGYVWMVAKREVAITEAIRIERRRRRRFGAQAHNRMPSDGSENELGLDFIPNVDITNRGSVEGLFGPSSNHQDGSALNSDYVGAGYLDDDEDEHEGQSLFGNLSLDPFQPPVLHHQPDDWRNVGEVDLDMSTDSENSSDYSDEEDNDGHGHRSPLDLERGMPEYGMADEEEEGGALDFSAHHAGLVDSPWRDEQGLEGVLEEEDEDGDDLIFHSNASKSGGNGIW